MKHAKKFLSLALVGTMLTACSSLTAFAQDDTRINQSTTDPNGATNINYDNNCGSYTVTIPASVDLSNTATTETAITAEDVALLPDWEISVYLSGASNTTNGQVFHAKNADKTSTAIYTITDGRDHYSVGDKIATFTENSSQPLVFSQAAGATKTGMHSEVLTFTIEAKDTVLVDALDLSTIPAGQSVVTIDKDTTVTGSLASNKHILVNNSATLTMKNVDIQVASGLEQPAIEFTSDGRLASYGYNVLQGGKNSAAIKANAFLEIVGNGTLDVTGSENAPGIAVYYHLGIIDGKIIAHGGTNAAGIGGGKDFNSGNIDIAGGDITAVGGEYGAGIGAAGEALCSAISISGGKVRAYGGKEAAGIGNASGNGDLINISDADVYAVGGERGAGIGTGSRGLCNGITIYSGTVTAIGGEYAAGIGTGLPGTITGNIFISADITSVTATKGEYAAESIKAGTSGGEIRIEDPTKVTQN
ncbi:MAG: hypothetical protein VZR73_03555 [Acutalibacteraceae bacterium]|nr:hypothetical protein [Acutalibacteraceae bacterium]